MVFADLVREFSYAGGAGPLALGGPTPGCRSFASVVPGGQSFHYAIAGVTLPAEWEVGTGSLDGQGRLVRNPAASSAGGAAVAFSTQLKTVALTVSADWFEDAQALLERPAGSDVVASGGVKAVADLPSTYPMGVSEYRTGTGFPHDGVVLTARHPDDHQLQIDLGFAGTQRLAVRHGRGGVWGAWDGGRTLAAPTFQNGWSNYNATFSLAGYQRDPFGRVFLEGIVKGGTTTGYTTILTLPAGYRPGLHQMLPAATNAGAGMVNVTPQGEVKYVSGGAVHFTLTGINFLADQ